MESGPTLTYSSIETVFTACLLSLSQLQCHRIASQGALDLPLPPCTARSKSVKPRCTIIDHVCSADGMHDCSPMDDVDE